VTGRFFCVIFFRVIGLSQGAAIFEAFGQRQASVVAASALLRNDPGSSDQAFEARMLVQWTPPLHP
jgi:hypothetical protein